MKKSTSTKVGFKNALAQAEMSLKFEPNKFDYDQKYKQNQKKILEKKVGPPKGAEELKSYKSGVKDMKALRNLFSPRFCKQMVFCLGLNRKTKESDPKLKAYCDGFCDELLT